MNKYINAEKLIAEIERLYDGEAPKHDQQCDFDDGYFTGIGAISRFIDSLQQEQPEVDGIEFRCGFFSGPIFPAWIDAPSGLQPAHKYHGLEVIACHLKGGGYRVVPRNKPISFELPESTHLVGGWKDQPEDSKGKFVFPKFLYARTTDNKTIDVSYVPQSMDAIEYVRNDYVEEQPEVDLEKFTQKMNDWKARYNHPDNIPINATMAFTARMFYQYPNVAREWYAGLSKATQD